LEGDLLPIELIIGMTRVPQSRDSKDAKIPSQGLTGGALNPTVPPDWLSTVFL